MNMNFPKNRKLFFLLLSFCCLLFSLKSSASTPNTVLTNLVVSTTSDGRIFLDWNASSEPDSYLIIVKEGSAETSLPQNGQVYNGGDAFGSGEVFAIPPGIVTGNIIASDFFPPGRHYFFTIYPFNGTGSNTMYRTIEPAEVSFVNPGIVPIEPDAQPTNFTASVSDVDNGTRTITFDFNEITTEASSPYETKYLILYRVNNVVNFVPTDGESRVISSSSFINIGGGQFGKLNSTFREESFQINSTQSEQEVFFKIYAFNRAINSFSPSNVDQRNSANYLTSNPLTMSVIVPAEGVNTPPEINDATFSINENPQPDSRVGNIDITDNQSDPVSLSIVSGNIGNAFFVDDVRAALLVSDNADIDFETTPVYNLLIRATDDQGLTAEANIIVNLLNTNDNSPVFSNSTFTILEGSPVGTLVGTVLATDADGDDVTYSITSGNSEGAFTIDENSGEISVIDLSPLDFNVNPEFTLTISASDGLNSRTGTVTILLEEEVTTGPPTLSAQMFTIFENAESGSVIGTVIARDPDDDPITYGIISGNDDNTFSIDENTGVLMVNQRTNLNFATNEFVEIMVEVQDETGANSEMITLVLNQNFQFILPSEEIVFDENSFWTINVPYSDREGDLITFVSLEEGNSEGLLKAELSDNLNEIIISPISTTSGIDFEIASSFNIVLAATDGSDNTSLSETLLITIANLNDNMPSLVNRIVEVNQGLANGTLVASIMAADADNDQLTYSITNGNLSEAFTVDSESGEITVNNSDALSFETNPVFNLTIEVSDGTFQDTAILTINLLEEFRNMAPTINMQSFSIVENSIENTSIGIVEASDPEGDDLTFSIEAGNTNDAFIIGTRSGEILVANIQAVDFETTPQFNLVVAVSDGEFTETAIVSVIIIDEDEVILSVDESFNQMISYPNPVTEYFSLRNNKPENKIYFMDLSGKLITTIAYQRSNRYIVGGSLSAGIYKMIINDGTIIHSSTIIIK